MVFVLVNYRYSGIVIMAPNRVKKAGRELQLPSMNLLTNKTSSQQFLLRILKVIIQLREAAKASNKKKKKVTGRWIHFTFKFYEYRNLLLSKTLNAMSIQKHTKVLL